MDPPSISQICQSRNPEELSESIVIPGTVVPKGSRKTLQQIDEEFLQTKRYKELGMWFTNGLIVGFNVWFSWDKGPWPEYKYLFMCMDKPECLGSYWEFNSGESYKSWGTKARCRTEAYYKYLQWISNEFTEKRIDDNYEYEYEFQYCDITDEERDTKDFIREEKELSFLEKYAKRECYAMVVGALETPTSPELYKEDQWSPIEIFSEAVDTISTQYSIDLVDLGDFEWY